MSNSTIERWGLFEAEFAGPSGGNPYLDVQFDAVFKVKEREVRVPGFYDGDGIYRLRFMPETEGDWTFETRSQTPELDGQTGAFSCTAPSKGNHGPVRVRNQFHFAYADGTPFLSFGTTCYAWTHQPLEMQAQTLATLEKTGFNKIRMGIFPKDYNYNHNEPLHDIYELEDGVANGDKPNYAAFRHFDTQVAALRDLGIEADVILFHPYDRWQYSEMTEDQDYRFVAYMAARYGAFRNVWWALANEYDFMIDTKPMERWDRFFQILEEEDPHRHLKSIHNGAPSAAYNHRKPWVTHSCIQNFKVEETRDWRNRWGRPIINDEPEYEGNLRQIWGQIPAQELVHRFWVTMMRGGYAGHGETYEHPEDLIWWAKGGELRGESWIRLKWMRELLEEDAQNGFEPLQPEDRSPWPRIQGARDGNTTIVYFGTHQPAIWARGLPEEDCECDLDLIDPWNMTITPLEKVEAPGNHPIRHGARFVNPAPEAAFAVRLPSKPYLALRCRTKTNGR